MSQSLSGFLFRADSAAPQTLLVHRSSRLQHKREYIEGWSQYDYLVDEQIARVEMVGDPPYVHPLFTRWSAGRLIILSNHYKVCEYFADRDLRKIATVSLRRADIGVHELVIALSKRRETLSPPESVEANESTMLEWHSFINSYTVGYGWARTDAFGDNLRSLEFQGDNISDAALFRDAIPLARFLRCGLRRMIIDENGFPNSYELLKLGKRGFISLISPRLRPERSERFNEVENAIDILSRFGFIK